MPKFSLASQTYSSFSLNKSWIMSFKYGHSNLNIHCKSISENLVYVGQYQNFFNPNRSEERLRGKRIYNTLIIIYEPKACKVLQSGYNYICFVLAGLKLFKLYKKQICKISKKVQKIFTSINLIYAYKIFYYLIKVVNNYTKKVGRLKLSLYQSLCDPCFLLIVYSTLKNKRLASVNTVFIENVTLTSVISLSLEIQTKKYSPNPTKKIFIFKARGRMKLLNIISSKDKIVQQALKLVLEPFFENVFLDSSYGFRTNRSCHSVLRLIYHNWRGIKWFIKCNFVSYFDKISYLGGFSIFNEYINDY